MDVITSKFQQYKEKEIQINDKLLYDLNSHVKGIKYEVDSLTKNTEKRKALLNHFMNEVDFSSDEHKIFRSLLSTR